MGKTPKTVHFGDDQIKIIEEMAKEEDRPFGWIVRWLIDMALDAVHKEQEEEQEEK